MVLNPILTKKYKPSAIRRGRLSTTPTWLVIPGSGQHWEFGRKRDALAFIRAGCICHNHQKFLCPCGGRKIYDPTEAPPIASILVKG